MSERGRQSVTYRFPSLFAVLSSAIKAQNSSFISFFALFAAANKEGLLYFFGFWSAAVNAFMKIKLFLKVRLGLKDTFVLINLTVLNIDIEKEISDQKKRKRGQKSSKQVLTIFWMDDLGRIKAWLLRKYLWFLSNFPKIRLSYS